MFFLRERMVSRSIVVFRAALVCGWPFQPASFGVWGAALPRLWFIVFRQICYTSLLIYYILSISNDVANLSKIWQMKGNMKFSEIF